MSELKEAKQANSHIYVDSTTGDMYFFNGEKLVNIGKMESPQIGDEGDTKFRKKEDKEREERAKREAEEDGIEPETKEEKQARIERIKGNLGSEEWAKRIEDENKAQIDKDLAKKKAKKKEIDKYKKIGTLAEFELHLERFVANQVKREMTGTWKKPDMRYEGSGILRKGKKFKDNTHIPKINVYFDQSGSWGPSDIDKGMQAIAVLNKFVQKEQIKVDIYYFADNIHDSPGPARDEGGTSAGDQLINHINSTLPDNVIIMTDSDFDYTMRETTTATVPGAAWFLFRRGYMSIKLRQRLRGRGETAAFTI